MKQSVLLVWKKKQHNIGFPTRVLYFHKNFCGYEVQNDEYVIDFILSKSPHLTLMVPHKCPYYVLARA